MTDKKYQCLAEHIDLTLIVGGELVGFMAPSDIISLFSNALDNAIECERGVPEEEKRSIALNVFSRSQFVCIHVENYCVQQPVIRDGLPVTTKADHALHGFGMKSMRYIAEKYNGSLRAGTRENMFVLNILIPIPEHEG